MKVLFSPVSLWKQPDSDVDIWGLLALSGGSGRPGADPTRAPRAGTVRVVLRRAKLLLVLLAKPGSSVRG